MLSVCNRRVRFFFAAEHSRSRMFAVGVSTIRHHSSIASAFWAKAAAHHTAESTAQDQLALERRPVFLPFPQRDSSIERLAAKLSVFPVDPGRSFACLSGLRWERAVARAMNRHPQQLLPMRVEKLTDHTPRWSSHDAVAGQPAERKID